MALARAAQDVGAPHEHVARPVGRVVGVLAAHGQRAVLQGLHHVVLHVQALGLGVAHQLQRVGLQLRRTGQPAHALGAHVVVDHGAAVLAAVGQRGQHLFHAQLLVAPLVGVGVEEAGGVHLARRAQPVQRKGQRGPAGLRAQLFLAHVVRPAAAALAYAAAQHQHVDDAAVVHVAVVPVVHGRADDDHGLAARLLGVVGELARNGDHLVTRHAGDLFLPGRGVGRIGVIAAISALAFQTAVDAVVARQQVEHGGHEGLLAVQHHARDGHAAQQHIRALLVGVEPRRLQAAEVGEGHVGHFTVHALAVQHRELELHVVARARLLGFEVPQALVGAAGLAPAKADGAIGQGHAAVLAVGHGLPLGIAVLAQVAVEVAGAHIALGHQGRAAIGQLLALEADQQRQVGVAARIVLEIGRAAALAEVELLEDDVAHGHGHGGIRALLGVHPQVGQLGDLGVVGRDGHDLGALVADLGEEVGVGGARLGHVGAPGDDEVGVVPVGALRHVGLLAPGLGAGRRQVAVPVVEAHAHAADQAQVAAACGIRDHGHGRNRREADDAVRPVLLDGVDVGRRDHAVDLVPAAAHEAAQAALLLPLAARIRVLDDGGPGIDRAPGHGQGSAPVLEQPAAHHGVFDAVGAVQVPAVAGAARAAARLVVGQVGARARVVGLLGLPGHDAALDVDLPRARARAVHAVRGAHHLVMRPAVAVGVFPGAVLARHLAMAVGEFLPGQGEVGKLVQKMAHRGTPCCSLRCVAVRCSGACGPGLSRASRRSCARSTTRSRPRTAHRRRQTPTAPARARPWRRWSCRSSWG